MTEIRLDNSNVITTSSNENVLLLQSKKIKENARGK